MVSLGLSLMGQTFKEREAARMEIRVVTLEIMSLMEVAKNAGLISSVNYELLNEEFKKYLESLGFPQGLESQQGQAVLSRSFFVSETEAPKPAEVIKDKTPEYLPEPKALKTYPKNEVKERPLKDFGAVSVKKNSRQSIIIGLLKRKKEIMIKDVSPLISGCSEKTIQRELLAMVQAGILLKTGEKRWSRYSLA
ncbi:hypothetical protein KW807_00140 [Candidatus Parcubacteria bacterium]|nr:hypothetical protein [Candidatus Parcubacteria bacterium]